MTAHSKILTALHAVMTKVGYVQKGGHNKFHNYKYAGEADLLSVLRPAMLEAGLLLIPSQRERSEIDKDGNIFVAVDYTLAHKDGEVWPDKITAYGAGNDKSSKGTIGDKGLYKALTGANKYLLFKLFQIETGDDPEKDDDSHEEEKKDKSPPGISLAKVEVTQAVREINSCADGDSLLAYLNTQEFKKFAVKICGRFPSEWTGPEAQSGLRGMIEKSAKEHGIEGDVMTLLVKIEQFAKKDAK